MLEVQFVIKVDEEWIEKWGQAFMSGPHQTAEESMLLAEMGEQLGRRLTTGKVEIQRWGEEALAER